MMRYLLFTLSAVFCISLFSCNSGSSDVTIKEMSAKFRPYTLDTTTEVWKANPNLVFSSVPYAGSILFSGSDYETLNTNLELFIQSFHGEGKYPLYQATTQQSDSNYAKLMYNSKAYHTISGTLEILRSDDVYIGDFEFKAVYHNDTIAVTNGHFTISNTKK